MLDYPFPAPNPHSSTKSAFHGTLQRASAALAYTYAALVTSLKTFNIPLLTSSSPISKMYTANTLSDYAIDASASHHLQEVDVDRLVEREAYRQATTLALGGNLINVPGHLFDSGHSLFTHEAEPESVSDFECERDLDFSAFNIPTTGRASSYKLHNYPEELPKRPRHLAYPAEDRARLPATIDRVVDLDELHSEFDFTVKCFNITADVLNKGGEKL
ncbi:hypothetical protein QBC36DRAFT_360380 [Triangularia setosa]|uniref:Uncharacterized protein n=1 Tax=Triangularia setosa TaxID=2587417 RepID=A0AAN6W0Q5_9PEZI|nr:hypothetical protein QBC36DRAFT_360380 [Podospora setosa]